MGGVAGGWFGRRSDQKHRRRFKSVKPRWTNRRCPNKFAGSKANRTNRLNKRAVIKKITGKLVSELEVYFRAAQFARAEATHEQNKAENKYDTRGLEASYLAKGQSRQAAELESAIAEFEKLSTRPYTNGDPINLGALISLEVGGEKLFYFLGPRAGGTEVIHDRKEILVITPQSPLGEQLMGRKQGDEPQLSLGGAKQAAKIIAVE
jgi:transcription elongation GreA/GreB family factor